MILGLPISEDFSRTMKRQIPKAVSKLLAAFFKWASKSPEERLALETQESVIQLKSKFLRDHLTKRNEIIQDSEQLAATWKITRYR